LLADATAQGGVFIVDWMRLFATLGRVACVDERYWQIGRAPLAHAALVPLGREYGKFLRALRGQSKKCLVLDCDNTLWGGVVGEDGVAGIALGSGHPGSSFADFQTEIANLHDRGVILALCSKNDEAAVLEVVRTHPGMVLRERHFAAREINWDDKVTNLRRIAATLGIGLDSLVFVDDSPFEIEFVRTALPEVTTIALPPGGVANYRNILAAGGLFDSLAYTDEDRRKTALYAHERERTALAQAAGSLSEYLTKLDIRADVHPARDVDAARVAQLSQKSNQFNLTTQRYTESEIRTLARDAQATVLVLRLADRVADLGLVGAAIVRYARGAAEIEALFVSCRALGRGAEDAFLSAVVRAAWDRPDVATISGTFRPTEKNAIAAPFYTRCGFHAAGESAGTLRFALDRHAASAVPLAPAWIHLVTGAPAHAV
jgi:FkbH-like protein